MVNIGGTSRLKIIAAVGFIGFAIFAYRYSTFRISKNFVTVDEGRFYRSAQLTPEELRQVILEKGIKTVISLRGGPEHTQWYQDQVKVLQETGVDFKVVWWLAEYFPPKQELMNYLELLKTAQYPILVHCRVGSDRTGLATAIYAMDYLRTPKELAIAQHLNFDYWHVQTFKPAMVEFVKRYRGPLWAKNEFDPCAPENQRYMENPNCPKLAVTDDVTATDPRDSNSSTVSSGQN